MAIPKLFVGLRSASRILVADSNYTDDGTTYTGLATSARVAPAGIDGEVALFALHVAVQWEGTCSITVLPIVDDVRMQAQTFTLVGDSPLLVDAKRKSTILEVPVRLRFSSAIDPTNALAVFAARGTWIQAEVKIDVDANALNRGAVIIEGVSMELEVVREGKDTGRNP
jgi:hypothetical protein